MVNSPNPQQLNNAEFSLNDLFIEENFQHISREPFYFGEPDKNLLGWLHIATLEVTVRRKRTVIICAPLGMDYMNTYRAQRYIADYFALAGFDVLRFDYFATGDSSGVNSDRKRLTEWLESIKVAVDLMAQEFPENELNLLGIKMGATLAAMVSDRLDISNLMLWSPYTTGKKFLREVKALQMTSAFQSDSDKALLESGGIVYWPETEEEIKAIDLANISPIVKSIAFIGESNTPYKKLTDSWKDKVSHIEFIEATDTKDMFQEAHNARVPHNSIVSIVNWLIYSELKTKSLLNKLPNKIQIAHSMDFVYHADGPMNCLDKDICIQETFFRYGKEKQFFGLKARSSEYNKRLPKLIFLNSGTTHRVAPGRLYVHLARQACGLGYDVFRVDLPGLGDSIASKRTQEHDSYLASSYQAITNILKEIHKDNSDTEFVLMGLCSGAYFAFTALLNERSVNIKEAIMINPLTFYWDHDSNEKNTAVRAIEDWTIIREKLTSKHHWKKVFSFQSNYIYLLRATLLKIWVFIRDTFRKLLNKQISRCVDWTESRLDRDLQYIVSKNKQMTFFFASDDYGYELLMTTANIQAPKLIQSKKITLKFIENADHTFSRKAPRAELIGQIIKHLQEAS